MGSPIQRYVCASLNRFSGVRRAEAVEVLVGKTKAKKKIHLRCAACSHRLKLKKPPGGKKLECPKCEATIDFRCADCGARQKLKDAISGQKFRCNKCDRKLKFIIDDEHDNKTKPKKSKDSEQKPKKKISVATAETYSESIHEDTSLSVSVDPIPQVPDSEMESTASHITSIPVEFAGEDSEDASVYDATIIPQVKPQPTFEPTVIQKAQQDAPPDQGPLVELSSPDMPFATIDSPASHQATNEAGAVDATTHFTSAASKKKIRSLQH